MKNPELINVTGLDAQIHEAASKFDGHVTHGSLVEIRKLFNDEAARIRDRAYKTTIDAAHDYWEHPGTESGIATFIANRIKEMKI